MEKFKVKEKDEVKLGKNYLIGSVSFILLGLIISVWLVISLKSSLENNPIVVELMYLLPLTIVIFLISFGYFYFFWGLYKLRKVIKEISNIILIYNGIVSYMLFTPLFLSGFLNSIWCTGSVCKWRFSGLQLLMILLGVFMFFSSLFSLTYEIYKIKGDPLESYLLEQEQMKKSTITPISKTIYRIRIEKIGEDLEKSNYICGNCGEQNRFKILDDKSGLLKCIKCGSENYLDE